MTTPPPRALPVAGWLGPLVALLLVALGVVLGQDALSRWGVLGRSWLGAFADDVDGLRAGTWTLPAGVLVVVLGLLLLVVALKPRRRTHVAVAGDADLWFSPGALEALARDAADGVNGVARLSVVASTSAVRVRVAAEHPDDVAPEVERAVGARLEGADVRVSVKAHRYRGEGATL